MRKVRFGSSDTTPGPFFTLLVLMVLLTAWPSVVHSLSFSAPRSYPVGPTPFDVAAGDLNEDGIADLVVVGGDACVSVLLGLGGGYYSPRTVYACQSEASGIAIAELDGDGHLDVAVTRTAIEKLSILRGVGSGTLSPLGDYATGRKPVDVAVGDIDHDGLPDLATANAGYTVTGWSLSVFRANGPGTFAPGVIYPSGKWASGVSLADINEDGALDLAASVDGSSSFSTLLGDGVGGFGPLNPQPIGDTSNALVSAHLNDDGHVDLAFATNGNRAKVMIGNGDGSFQPVMALGSGSSLDIAVGDLDGDGDIDLASSGLDRSSVTIFLSHGDGSFEPGIEVPASGPGRAVAVADLDGDGRRDLAVANQSSTVSVMLNQGPVGVDPSLAPPLRLDGPRSNPTIGDLEVDLALPNMAPAYLDLVDIAGRRWAGRDVGSLGPGSHRVRLASSGELRPGVYWIRLRQDAEIQIARVVVMH